MKNDKLSNWVSPLKHNSALEACSSFNNKTQKNLLFSKKKRAQHLFRAKGERKYQFS